jgi:menaquinone-dependent protoporphyrinogen IX oxidase
MSGILIPYGTTEGQTAKIANALAQSLRAQGDGVRGRCTTVLEEGV